MKKFEKLFKRSLSIVLIALICSLLVFYIKYRCNIHNPFNEVNWLTEYPGVSDRYVEYTPVLIDDKGVVLGPTVGADYAKLRFKDIGQVSTNNSYQNSIFHFPGEALNALNL